MLKRTYSFIIILLSVLSYQAYNINNVAYAVDQPVLKAPWKGVATIPQGTHANRNPMTHADGTRGEHAIDIQNVNGVENFPVFASYSGKIIYKTFHKNNDGTEGYGNCIIIEHNNGDFFTLYGHLSEFDNNISLYNDNQIKGNVITGQKLGIAGKTGRANDIIHLHFQVQDKNWFSIEIKKMILKDITAGDKEFGEYNDAKLKDELIVDHKFQSYDEDEYTNRPILAVDSSRNIYKMNMDGSNKTKIYGPFGDTGDRVGYMQISGDGKKILAVVNSSDSNYLCMIDLNIMTHKKIYQTEYWMWNGDISHCGRYVCFYYNNSTESRAYIINSDGSNVRSISISSGDETAYPALSPDGSKIVFAQFKHGRCSIYVSNIDLSNPRIIFESDKLCENMCFSYDGQDIYSPIDNDLYKINIETQSKTQVFNETGVWVVYQSQNGYKLTYVRSDGQGNSSLWTVHPNGSGKKQITLPAKTSSVTVDISVDGEYILYYYQGGNKIGKSDGTDTQDIASVLGIPDLACTVWYPQVSPFAPTNLTVSSADNGIRIQWNKAFPGHDPKIKYNVYRRKKDTIYAIIASDLSDLYFNDTQVVKDKRYYYVVTAIDSSGNESDYSNEESGVLLVDSIYPPQKNPILLVHGLQLLGTYHPVMLWKEMIYKITGQNISAKKVYELFKGMFSLNLTFTPAHAVEPIWYSADDLSKKKHDCYIFRVKAIDLNHQDVFISDYSAFVTEGNLNDWNHTRGATRYGLLAYAWKLKTEIQKIKKLTGANQVDIIAHSMGGLVSRTYIERTDFDSSYAKTKGIVQQSGPYDPVSYNNDINTLFTVGTPNHGTTIAKLPPDGLFECVNQMVQNSDFLKILNYGENKIFNINLVDRIHQEVTYITLTGIIPINGAGTSCKITSLDFNECIKNSTESAEKAIASSSYTSLVPFGDGLVPGNESRIYGTSANLYNYYYLHADHGQLVRSDKPIEMILTILNKYQKQKMDFKTMKSFWKYYGKGTGPTWDKSVGDIIAWCPVNVIVKDQNNKIVVDTSQFPVYTAEGYFYDAVNEEILFFFDTEQQWVIDIQGYDKGEFNFALTFVNLKNQTKSHYEVKNQPIVDYQTDRYKIHWDGTSSKEPTLVIEIDENGDNEFETIIEPPSPPKNLICTYQNNLIHLSWNPSTTKTYTVKQYEIYRIDSDQAYQKDIDGNIKLFHSKLISTISSTKTTYFDSDIEQGKSYTYYVIAVDTQNQPSLSSNFVTMATAISPYTIINLRIGSKAASIIKKGNLTNVTLDLAPFTKSERTLVPLRFIAESFGAEVKWTEDNGNTGEGEILIGIVKTDGSKTYIRLHTLVKKAQVVKYKPNSNKPLLGEYLLDVAPFIVRPENRTVVPIRFIAEGFGSEVKWFAETKKIEIYYLP